MDMNGTAGIMTRNNGLEAHGAVLAGDLDSSQSLVLKIGSVVRVAIHRANDARIYASGVRGPDLDRDIIEGLAGIDVHNLNVEVHINPFLPLFEVFANLLALNICVRISSVVPCEGVFSLTEGPFNRFGS
jgi:hypothetical protein